MAGHRRLGRVGGKFVRRVGRQKVNSQRLDKDEGKKCSCTALTIQNCISSRNSDFVNLTISVMLFYVVISL